VKTKSVVGDKKRSTKFPPPQFIIPAKNNKIAWAKLPAILNLEKVIQNNASHLSNLLQVNVYKMAVLPDFATQRQFQSMALNVGNCENYTLELVYQQH
jgi:hypothetical protein